MSISIVTTYKNRPNYTSITYCTLREAISRFYSDFKEPVSLYFYDDASTVPRPEVVKTVSMMLGVEAFAEHRNERSMGAEWGNIDAITKCFERFPKSTHVFVLDNDLCVHPFALHAIKRMIQDLPEFGYGSVFNSNVFAELQRVNERYVVKEVNPGLGSVIQREAWFWHLERSKGTKLDKDSKHPGWDWNLSAWMRDSGKWGVYATYHSFVEHIGAVGTNVKDDYMTRGRRFYDKVEVNFQVRSSVVDILMPVKDMAPDAIERMRWCIRSLRRNPGPFNLCISDSSSKPMKRELEEVIGMPFKYFHEAIPGLFNRSRTINNGIRHLVTSDPFIVMDTDVVVPSNFLEKFTALFKENNNFVVGRLGYLGAGHEMTDDWSALNGKTVNFFYNSGFFMCSLPLFLSVNGFDEEYVGWGAEDDSLNVRMTVATGGQIRKLVGMEMTAWHLFHPRKDTLEKDACEANRARYWKQKALVESGQVKPWQVLGLEDKRG